MSLSTIPPIWRSSTTNLSFKKQFELSVEDHMAARYARTEPLTFGRFAGFVTLCTLFAGLIVAFGQWKSGEQWLAVGIVAGSIAAGLVLSWLLYGFFRSLFKGFWRGFLEQREAIHVPVEITVDAGGVCVVVRQQTWFCPWESLRSVEEDARYYYFWTSNMQAHILPKRLLDDSESASFASNLRIWWGREPIAPQRRMAHEL